MKEVPLLLWEVLNVVHILHTWKTTNQQNIKNKIIHSLIGKVTATSRFLSTFVFKDNMKEREEWEGWQRATPSTVYVAPDVLQQPPFSGNTLLLIIAVSNEGCQIVGTWCDLNHEVVSHQGVVASHEMGGLPTLFVSSAASHLSESRNMDCYDLPTLLTRISDVLPNFPLMKEKRSLICPRSAMSAPWCSTWGDPASLQRAMAIDTTPSPSRLFNATEQPRKERAWGHKITYKRAISCKVGWHYILCTTALLCLR